MVKGVVKVIMDDIFKDIESLSRRNQVSKNASARCRLFIRNCRSFRTS